MAKHPGKCPKCGARLEFDTAVDEQVLCSNCQALLSLPGKTRPSDRVDPLIGQTLGELEIVELLGRGGMGAVYKARQPSLDRFVAVKVLPRAFSHDASFIERFSREARDAAAVLHANIIQVYAVGQDRGHEYIAMELVDGENLADVVRREGPLSPERVLAIMKQVVSALAEAHEAGIIHRDVKPSNILLTAKGQAKVADFGLAKRPGTDASVTLTGARLGTPLYFPPEMARGKPADARSDLYSLGATFYHLLAGRPPFEGQSTAELVLQHAEARVPPLAEAAPGAPRDLCRAVHRLLRKNPSERYQSAMDLLQALERVGGHLAVSQFEPTQTMPETTHRSIADRHDAKQRRRLTVLAAVIGGVAIMALAVVAVVVLSRRAAEPDEQAVTPKTPATPIRPATHEAPKDDGAERNAQIVFNNAQTCVDRRDWAKARVYLDRLEARYGKTRLRAARAADIEALRAKIRSALKPVAPAAGDWEAAWKECEAKAKGLMAEQRFGDAIAAYDALVDRFQDLALRQRVEGATAQVRKQSDSAWRGIESRAKQLMAANEFADARAALAPVAERYGLPDKAALAKALLTEIATAEKEQQTAQASEREEAARRAAAERRRQAEQRYARALEAIDKRIAAWDFRGAAEALKKLDFPEADLAARLATRRDEVGRLAQLKARMIAKINTAQPRLRKSSLLIPGVNGDLVSADERAITAKLANSRTEAHAWLDLSTRTASRLVQLVIDRQSADDCLAAGILALALDDAPSAEKHFEEAKSLGASIKRYLGPLARAALAEASARLERKEWQQALATLDALEKRYAETPWLAAHEDDVTRAREQARDAIAEAKAERLYARAVALFQRKGLFELKPLVERLKADHPRARAVTDTARKPTFAEMAAAVAKVGKLLTVRKDGKGEYTTVQGAISLAPPRSVIEIQDSAFYDEKIVIAKGKEGITVRGAKGRWPVIHFTRLGSSQPLVHVTASGVAFVQVVLTNYDTPQAYPDCLRVQAGPLRLQRVILYAKGNHHPVIGPAGTEIDLCLLTGGRPASFQGEVKIRDSLVMCGVACAGEAPLEAVNSVMGKATLDRECRLRRCTLPGGVDFRYEPNSLSDCIVRWVETARPKNRIDFCDLYDKSPLAGLAKPGKRCFSADPQFVHPGNLDFRLKRTSPCRGKASDGGDIGCRYTPEMLEMLKLALELRKKGIIKF